MGRSGLTYLAVLREVGYTAQSQAQSPVEVPRWKSPDRDEGGLTGNRLRPIRDSIFPGRLPGASPPAMRLRPFRTRTMTVSGADQNGTSRTQTGQNGTKRGNPGQSGTELGRTGQVPKIVSAWRRDNYENEGPITFAGHIVNRANGIDFAHGVSLP